MPDRDLDITKFSYLSYRSLKKALGEFDAVVECNELAIREFIYNASNDNSQDYIQMLSSKHSVKVNEVDFYKFSSRIRQYYVASVFQQCEQFFKDFKEEWCSYFSEMQWEAPKKGETGFQNILRNTSVHLDSDLIDTYEYYRLIRNYMAHTDRDIGAIRCKHAIVKNNINNFLDKMHLSATPNKLEEIGFDDFIILSNIVKHIAFTISSKSKPSNEIIAKILFLQLSKDDTRKSYNGLKKLKNNQDRYEKAIKNYAATMFGRFSRTDIEDIYTEFKRLLA